MTSNPQQLANHSETGVEIPCLLTQDDAELAAVAFNGDVLLYYYNNQSTLSIRELNIRGTPGSRSSPETFNLEEAKMVAQPALIADGQPALYQPLGAVLANATGAEPSIYVSWAERNTGANTSYGALTVVHRKISDEKWPDSSYGKGEGQVAIPLGNQNVDPHS